MERTRITIFDTTLRDGEQSPGCSMNVQEKQKLARQLDRLGVDVIEAGFPIASDGDFTAVQSIAAEIRPRIHVFLATSDIHLQYKLKISRQKCLEQAREAVRLAKSFCQDVEFSPEDATRTDMHFLCEVLNEVIEAGATTLNIPDTVGYSVPADFGAFIREISQKVKNQEKGVVISAHCHND